MSEEASFGDIEIIMDAMNFALDRHEGQTRKDCRTPYFRHVQRTAQLLWTTGEVKNYNTIAAALLHDTIEDTKTTKEELADKFGVEVCAIVLEVTDDKSLPKEVRKQLQIEHAPHISRPAKLIKLADKISNIEDILNNPPDWNKIRKKDYIEWAKKVIAGVRSVNPQLEAYFDDICEKAETKLK